MPWAASLSQTLAMTKTTSARTGHRKSQARSITALKMKARAGCSKIVELCRRALLSSEEATDNACMLAWSITRKWSQKRPALMSTSYSVAAWAALTPILATAK